MVLRIGKKLNEIQLQMAKPDKTFIVLEDDHRLDQMGLLDDSIVYLTFMVDGKWEAVNIQEYPAVQDK